MRFSTAREVWLELKRLYDGICEDKAFNLCTEFFSYTKQQCDDVATHMSKLKHLWKKKSPMKVEIMIFQICF
jgi:hypothetical protein